MTRGDKLIALIVMAVALLSASQAGALLAPSDGVVMLRGPQGVTAIDPSQDGVYVIAGHSGEVTFEAQGGEVRAVRADCPDHLCVRSGALAPGRPIVCAPNGVSATLVAREGRGLDAVSR